MCVKQGTGIGTDDCADPMPCLIVCKRYSVERYIAERIADQVGQTGFVEAKHTIEDLQAEVDALKHNYAELQAENEKLKAAQLRIVTDIREPHNPDAPLHAVDVSELGQAHH